MKPFISIFFIFLTTISFSQQLPDFSNITLDKVEDYKVAEPKVLNVANFVLNTPINQQNLDYLNSIGLIIKWMGGTPDYTFNLDENVIKYTSSNNDLLGVYMAALTKNVLEDETLVGNDKKLTIAAMTTFANYCEDKDNKVKLNRKLKKLIASKNSGTLESLLFK